MTNRHEDVERAEWALDIERDIRIAIWNGARWQGSPQEVAQSLIRKIMAEPTMVRALEAISQPSTTRDAPSLHYMQIRENLDRHAIEIANEAVRRNLEANGEPKHQSAQGFACAKEAAMIALSTSVQTDPATFNESGPAFKAGVREGMEKAAKVAGPAMLQCECCRDTSIAIAAAIRQLIQQEGRDG